MNVRDLIYELIQGSLENVVRIYDVDTHKLYETEDIEFDDGYVDLIIRSKEKDLSGTAIPSRSSRDININQANCSTNEGIKQVHLFSSNQLMILISILNRNIESLENGFTDDAIISLKRLTKNLMKNLRGEEN